MEAVCVPLSLHKSRAVYQPMSSICKLSGQARGWQGSMRFMLNIGPYTNVPQSVDWLVSHVLEDSGITSIIGAPNAGKTFIAVDIACSVATGAKALGVFKTRQANVLYLATESVRGLSTRISG